MTIPSTSSVRDLPPSPKGYRLIREIGSGGMGVVYEAEQFVPERRVAIKLLGSSLASPARVARFRVEAQALARLQHAHVAAIHEAGVLDTDVGPCPFLVMEMIDGLTLTRYAEHAHLSISARVELMVTVADAVHHAHTRGVIHRDLKPQNVLVAATVGAKVLDFGLARLDDTGSASETRHTTDGQLLGTAAYMSPEQFEHGAASADTRSDTYALGVMLYELLSGRVPLDLDLCSLAEAARRVRDELPVPLGKLDSRLRGDLERITAMAMHRDPERRYASAGAFAEDLRCHLGARPIMARPANGVDRTLRFVRRHRALSASAAVLAVSLLVGVAMLTMMLRATERERVRAQWQAETTQSVLDFLVTDILASIDPESVPAAGLTMRAVLDQAAIELEDGRFDGRPSVQLAIRSAIGRTYMNLTEYDLAEPHLERALVLAETIDPGGIAELTALNELGMLLMDQGRFEPADGILSRAVRLADTVRPPNRMVLATLNNLGALRSRQGRSEHAAEALLRAEAIAAEQFPDAPELLDISSSLAVVLAELGRFEEALVRARASFVAYERTRGPNHPYTLTTKNTLAGLLSRTGQHEHAVMMFREVLAARLELLGMAHVDTLVTRATLARALLNEGNAVEAVEDASLAAEGLADKLGTDHPYAKYAAQTLGQIREQLGKP